MSEKKVKENVDIPDTEETEENTLSAEEYEELLAKKDEELNAKSEQYQRLLAEYDNFKKRTAREKEAIYSDSVKDTVAELLPVIDNLLRAVDAFADKDCEECKGVSMVLKQTEEIFAKIGVSEIKAVGEQFNPELHNAVMHVDDDKIDDNTVVEEFQKGYIYKDKVIRYSMVKVAN
ncbi:MAG: nucleotide exchange factor GrpE [Clostridia bacterium]|nr:nucleotide exchange factor GrpE [Clostridia bacterium]